MTDRTITLPLRRWHKLLKAMGEVRPGLTTDAAFCDKVTAMIGEAVFNQMGIEPFAITRPDDSWRNLVNFCGRYGIHHRDIYDQLLGVKVEPKPEPVDPEALALAKELLAADDDEFDWLTRPQETLRDEATKQPTLFE